MALDYLTYYLAGFIWGIFFRDFWFSGTILSWFQVFFFFVFGQGSATDSEFWLWLPLSFLLASIIGLGIPTILYVPHFLSIKYFENQFYVAKIILEIVALHALLIFWELLPNTPFAWGGIIEFVVFLVAIIVLFWINRYDFIWSIPDGKGGCIIQNCCVITFYTQFAFFFLPVILLFTIVISIVSGFWGFWLVLGSFIVSCIALIILHFILPPPEVVQTVNI